MRATLPLRPPGRRSAGRSRPLTDLLVRVPPESGRTPERARAREPFWRRPVLQFVTAMVAVILLLCLITAVLARRAALHEAVRDARTSTQQLARAVVQPNLPRGLTAGSPAAIAATDRLIRGRVLSGWLVRVKIWDGSGRILYSDEPRLIGDRFALEPTEVGIVQHGGDAAELSDLKAPENRFEKASNKLYETYAQVHSPEGTPLLFEAYYRYSDLNKRSNEILSSFEPLGIGGPLLLGLITVPLVWGLARRLRRARADRERLLLRALDSSDLERRRIARDLHDGVVQELAGASFALSAAADAVRAEPGSSPATSASLDRVAAGVRHSMRSLRSLLVDIYPPSLHDEGLAAALTDLLAPLPGGGTQTSLTITPDLDLAPETSALVYRVAQEAVRNAQRHAEATHLDVEVSRQPDRVVLVVQDDGHGFDPAIAEKAAADGHVGLRLLKDLVAEAGGELSLRSGPAGTTIRLEVAAP
jgi:two-component system NarL family sensor kinase